MKINESSSYAIGLNRCWWRDVDDGWQVRIDHVHGSLRITAGGSNDEWGGEWDENDGPCVHYVTGRSRKCLIEFTKFVVEWTGDNDRIEEAVEHLLGFSIKSFDNLKT